MAYSRTLFINFNFDKSYIKSLLKAVIMAGSDIIVDRTRTGSFLGGQSADWRIGMHGSMIMHFALSASRSVSQM